jgi:hypothetical protein
LAFFRPGSQCELPKAFRQQLREAAAIGRWETDWKGQGKQSAMFGMSLGNNCYLLAAPVHARPLFFIDRIRGRLSLKELGRLAGGIHHNAVGIAIRRFTQHIQSDRTLLEKVSLVLKELEPR